MAAVITTKKIEDNKRPLLFLADYRIKNWNSLKQELIRWYELLGQIGELYGYHTNSVY